MIYFQSTKRAVGEVEIPIAETLCYGFEQNKAVGING